MRINGKEYGLRLTVQAAINVEKVCPGGRIVNMKRILKQNAKTALESVCRIIAILSAGYADSEKEKGRDEKPVGYEELVRSCTDELFFSSMIEAITETFERDYFGKINSRPTKKGREAHRKTHDRDLESAFPWYAYFGRRHGMSADEVRNMPFGELQDLMTCDAIYHGFAEEVAKKKKLTQEEMLALE